MTPSLPWIFEECSPEDATDPQGQPWAHAVRGRKPAGRAVTGYGHTPPASDADARTKATQYDAREVLGQRGEVIPPIVANDIGCATLETQCVAMLTSTPVDLDLTKLRKDIDSWINALRRTTTSFGDFSK